MTEIHTYRCDVCGKNFDFEDDCRKHTWLATEYLALLQINTCPPKIKSKK